MMPDEYTPLTADEMAAIRERADGATPGPWDWRSDMHWIRTTDEWPHTIAEVSPAPESLEGLTGGTIRSIWAQADRDGELLAAARTDVPRLLATLDAYREIVRAVAAGPLATTHGDLACVFCERWIGPGQSHAPDCPTVVARALLGDTP